MKFFNFFPKHRQFPSKSDTDVIYCRLIKARYCRLQPAGIFSDFIFSIFNDRKSSKTVILIWNQSFDRPTINPTPSILLLKCGLRVQGRIEELSQEPDGLHEVGNCCWKDFLTSRYNQLPSPTIRTPQGLDGHLRYTSTGKRWPSSSKIPVQNMNFRA